MRAPRSELDDWKQAASVEAGLRREFHGKLQEARDWLKACLGMVEGRGPPNWDGIREFLKRTELEIAVDASESSSHAARF